MKGYVAGSTYDEGGDKIWVGPFVLVEKAQEV